MPRLEYFLVCRSASVDMFTDEITLAGVLEDAELDEDGFGLIPRAVAVGVWNLADADADTDFQAILQVTFPGAAAPQEFPLNLSKGRHRLRVILGLDVPLDAPGDLTFELLLNGKHQATHRVFVHQLSTPPPKRDVLYPSTVDNSLGRSPSSDAEPPPAAPG